MKQGSHSASSESLHIVISLPQSQKWLLWVSVIYGTEGTKKALRFVLINTLPSLQEWELPFPALPPSWANKFQDSPAQWPRRKDSDNSTWHVERLIDLKSFPCMVSHRVHPANPTCGVEAVLLFPFHRIGLGPAEWLRPDSVTSKLARQGFEPRSRWPGIRGRSRLVTVASESPKAQAPNSSPFQIFATLPSFLSGAQDVLPHQFQLWLGWSRLPGQSTWFPLPCLLLLLFCSGKPAPTSAWQGLCCSVPNPFFSPEILERLCGIPS